MTTPRYAVSLLTLAISVGVSSGYAVERTTNYTYHPSGTNGAGQVATMDGPRLASDVNDISSYAYDASGNLASVTNALGHVTQYSDYNGRGLAGKVTDANGVDTLLEYHVRGWLTKTTVKDPGGNTSLDAVTSFTYDAVGQITRITLPDNSYLDFEYDAAQRLVAIQNNLNERIEYTLDAAGNRTKEDVKNSSGVIVKTQTRVFDELSRLMRDVGASNQTTQVGYDKNDNATQVTDAKLNPTGQAYDALNRLVTQTDPDNNTINYTYDSQDRIKTVTDQRGLVTTYTYNGHGDLLSIDSPDTGITSYEYDAAGNRTKQTDARGVVVNYSYDALNRLTAISYPASSAENVIYTYDDTANGNRGIGRLTKIDDASGDTRFKYDHRNNLIEKTTVIESRTYTLLYSYDLANNLTEIAYPSGRLVNYSRDTAGRIDAVTTQANGAATAESVISAVTYAPFGPMATYTYGNGMTHSVAYDQDYRITNIEAQGSAAVLDLNYSYDPNSNITNLADQKTTAESQTFDYDKLNRLIDADGGYGELDYEYDAVGNRTKKITKQGVNTTTDTYSYSSTSNRLNQVASNDGSTTTNRTLQYDANGNVMTDTKADGTVHSLAYNNANRYSILTKNSATTAVYEYNALGQRVAKTSQNPTQDEHYHYDSAGMLLAATKPTDGNPIREYIYLDSMKVAVLANTNPSGTAPVATDDTATTQEDTALNLATATLLSNDTDANNDALSITAVTGASGGTATLDTNTQTINFTPTADFNGGAHFDYTVSDGTLTDTGRVNITVTAVNDAPVAVNDTITTDEDVAAMINLADLLSNDIDVDGDALSITGVSNASNGAVVLDTAAGTVTFTPTANYSGPASFDYTLSDGTVTTTGTVSLTVNAVNDAPVAVNDTASTTQDTALTIDASTLLMNDTDAEGSVLTITAVSNAVNGTAVLNTSTAVIAFTPASEFTGAASFDYTLSDGELTATATVNVTVDAVTTGQTIEGTDGTDTLVGTPGNDLFILGKGSDVLSGMGGDDVFQFTAAANSFFGGSKHYDGGEGQDSILGTSANDTILVRSLVNIEAIDGGAGYNKIELRYSSSNILDFSGTILTNIDELNGNGAHSRITGSAGDDHIVGGGGDDTLNGGLGNDTFSVTGESHGSDHFNGGDGQDTIIGSADDDVIGIRSITGIEAIDGGDGYDTVIMRYSSVGVLDMSNVTLTGIEELSGNGDHITIIGTASADRIFGGSGDDNLQGGAGDDTFPVSGTSHGSDHFNGGDGQDTITGSADDDVIGIRSITGIEAIDGGDGYDTVIMRYSSVDVLDMSNVTLTGIEELSGNGDHITIIGTASADRIFGGSGDDNLQGGAGDDTFPVSGTSHGSDHFNGGDGQDTIIGSADDDVIGIRSITGIEAIDGGDGYDTLIMRYSSVDVLDMSNVTLTGIEELSGNGDHITIIGSVGNDRINGGNGDDTLKGKNGSDTYLFKLGDDKDIIQNHSTTASADTDQLQLTNMAHNLLWLRKSGDDLVIDYVGSGDRVTIDDWYLGTAYELDKITASGKELTANRVAALVTAMATISSSEPASITGLTAQQQSDLAAAQAIAWQEAP